MIEVKCEKCSNTYTIKVESYKRSLKKKGKFYCSENCKNGTPEERFWKGVNKTNNIEE